MSEHVPIVCRVLRFLRLHGRAYVRDAHTPIPHDACRGCGRMFPRA